MYYYKLSMILLTHLINSMNTSKDWEKQYEKNFFVETIASKISYRYAKEADDLIKSALPKWCLFNIWFGKNFLIKIGIWYSGISIVHKNGSIEVHNKKGLLGIIK